MQISNNTNSVNFQARLDLSKVKGSRQRWNNIAKIFEGNSKNNSKDVLSINGSFSDGLYITTPAGNEVEIYKSASKKLKDFSDKEIAKKLKMILRAIKKENEFYKYGSKMEKSMPEQQDNKFWDFMVKYAEEAKSKILAKDEFFQLKDAKGAKAVEV
jgi:hypothetical protein